MTVQREHAFQGIADRFIDRVMLAPYWTTGINHENELTDNARARARGRGVKPGVPDIYIAQGGRSCWIELKWGSNQPSDAQIAVHDALTDCQIARSFAWSIHGIMTALLGAGFSLHPNALNIAVEYQARAEAAVAKAEERASRPRSRGRARSLKPTPAQVRRVRAAGVLV
jgi:hypothetical protein